MLLRKARILLGDADYKRNVFFLLFLLPLLLKRALLFDVLGSPNERKSWMVATFAWREAFPLYTRYLVMFSVFRIVVDFVQS
jgi:hypothetical protein